VSQWWDPSPGEYYWPPGVPKTFAVDSFVEAYEAHGFERCADGSVKQGFEKIVIYASQYGGVEHVARQLSDGRWTSKMGAAEDIVHESPHSLSVGYGQPVCFMSRPSKAGSANAGSTEAGKEEEAPG
jgi:hypothetical protein